MACTVDIISTVARILQGWGAHCTPLRALERCCLHEDPNLEDVQVTSENFPWRLAVIFTETFWNVQSLGKLRKYKCDCTMAVPKRLNYGRIRYEAI